MKKLFSFMVAFMAIFGFGFGTTTAWADASKGDDVRNPTVPIEVFKMGRQAVFRHLLLSVRAVQIEITGRSVVTQDYDNVYYINSENLEGRGYRFNGSFSDLSDVIDSYEYRVNVISLVNGSYDVLMKIKYIDGEGNTALLGTSWITIKSEKAGVLFSDVEPWVDMPENVNVSFPGNDQYRLKWFSGRYDESESMEFWTWAKSTEQGFTILSNMPTSKLGYGYLSVSGLNGNISVLDLSDYGYEISPQDLFVLMDKSGSSSILVINNPKTLVTWNNGVKAFQYGQNFYGRVPILEVINVNSDVDEFLDFSIQVGESIRRIYPFNAKVISLDDGKTTFLERAENGKWHLQLKKGGRYHILIDYGDQIIDWSAGPALG